MDLQTLNELAARAAGRKVEIKIGPSAQTDGISIMIMDIRTRHPDLPEALAQKFDRRFTVHESVHIRRFMREAKKRRMPTMTALQFNERYALPVAPDEQSKHYTCTLLNMVEDAGVNVEAGEFVSPEDMAETSQFLVWNRQGGRRPSIAEYEAMGPEGKCAAFHEAVFQFQIYGRLIEPFYSKELERAARDAAHTIGLFGKGSVSRVKAMEQVMSSLRQYCPPPWREPEDYVGPGDAIVVTLPPEMLPPGKLEGEQVKLPQPKVPPKKVGRAAERNPADDPNFQALLRMLEKVIDEHNDERGQGRPRWRNWTPGDLVLDPSELQRWAEEEARGTDLLRRRTVYQRDDKDHLMALFVDSSGSVHDELFKLLYLVGAALADKVSRAKHLMFGAGQFSGGAAWELHPTRDPQAIAAFAERDPKRLFNGSTWVNEIYRILGSDFAQYRSADLAVLTDGLTEPGKVLAKSLEQACQTLNCNIKLHYIVFRPWGTLSQARQAKELLPRQIRLWNLGENELTAA